MNWIIPIALAVFAACHAEIEENGGKQWALLVAGSNGWTNYRHQADIAHAYHILRKRGIPASNIVVMLYDDVAKNPENPRKGVLINRPHGPNVYKGIRIDYKKKDVTPEVFLAVLSGDKKAVKGKGTGRVIKSGPNDNVFVNFADHGGPGVLCFPNGDLSANELIKTLKKLGNDKKFAKLVLYIEACNAGSNFDQLVPRNTKILVSTASAPDESSWGAYCDYKKYPCLGDLYSVSWMQHLDKKISSTEDLFDQYQFVRTKTNQSHVQLYGDFSVGPTKIKTLIGSHNHLSQNENTDDSLKESLVSSRDVALYYYKRMAKIAENKTQRLKYASKAEDLEKKRKFIDQTIHNIIMKVSVNDENMLNKVVSERMSLTKHILDGYTRVYRHFSERCFNLSKNPYILQHFYKFVNLCHMGYEKEVMEAIDNECDDKFPVISNTE